jgi:hypothetical protein
LWLAEDHIIRRPVTSESALAFRQDFLGQTFESVEDDFAINFSGYAKQGDASIIVTQSLITFLEDFHNQCILEVLWCFFFFPT